MATHKIHFPWNIQKLKGLLADQRQPFNKNKLPILALIFVASAALGIFIVNIIGLVNTTPVKTTISTGRQEAIPVERTAVDPVQIAVQAAPAQTIAMQTAPTLPVEKTPAPAEKAGSIERFTIDSYLYRAREYEMKGEYSKALASYHKVLDIEKDNFIVLNNISYIYLQLDLLKESLDYSLRAVKINRDYLPALVNVGIAYAKTGELESAEYHLTRALELEPANQDVRLNLALMFEREARFPEASEHYLKLVKFGNVSGALGLGRVYEKEGRTAEAITFYKKIYENNSVDKDTRVFVRKRIIVLQNK